MKGGKREGAGRKKGSFTKPQISDFVSKKKINELIEVAMQLALAGNTAMLIWILEHLFGKAPQNINMGSQDNNPMVIDLPPDVKTKLDKFLTTIKK